VLVDNRPNIHESVSVQKNVSFLWIIREPVVSCEMHDTVA